MFLVLFDQSGTDITADPPIYKPLLLIGVPSSSDESPLKADTPQKDQPEGVLFRGSITHGGAGGEGGGLNKCVFGLPPPPAP